MDGGGGVVSLEYSLAAHRLPPGLGSVLVLGVFQRFSVLVLVALRGQEAQRVIRRMGSRRLVRGSSGRRSPADRTWLSSASAPSAAGPPCLPSRAADLRRRSDGRVERLARENRAPAYSRSRLTRRLLLPPVLAEVGHHLAGLAAVAGVGARVDVEGEHRVSHLHLVAVHQRVRLALGFGLDGRKIRR